MAPVRRSPRRRRLRRLLPSFIVWCGLLHSTRHEGVGSEQRRHVASPTWALTKGSSKVTSLPAVEGCFLFALVPDPVLEGSFLLGRPQERPDLGNARLLTLLCAAPGWELAVAVPARRQLGYVVQLLRAARLLQMKEWSQKMTTTSRTR